MRKLAAAASVALALAGSAFASGSVQYYLWASPVAPPANFCQTVWPGSVYFGVRMNVAGQGYYIACMK